MHTKLYIYFSVTEKYNTQKIHVSLRILARWRPLFCEKNSPTEQTQKTSERLKVLSAKHIKMWFSLS